MHLRAKSSSLVSNGGFISQSKHFSFYIFDQYLTLSNLTVQYFCLASNLMLVLNGVIFIFIINISGPLTLRVL